MAHDPRVDVTMLPLFDGVSMIKWKLAVAEEAAVEVDGIGAGGVDGGHAKKESTRGYIPGGY